MKGEKESNTKNPMNQDLEINTTLFEQVKQMILSHPQAFDMGSMTGRTAKERESGRIGAYNGTKLVYDPRTMNEPSCGSACCLAGWGAVISQRKSMGAFGIGEVWEIAQQAFGITYTQADYIFHYEANHGDMDLVTAQEAADMIDRFLADPSAEEFN